MSPAAIAGSGISGGQRRSGAPGAPLPDPGPAQSGGGVQARLTAAALSWARRPASPTFRAGNRWPAGRARTLHGSPGHHSPRPPGRLSGANGGLRPGSCWRQIILLRPRLTTSGTTYLYLYFALPQLTSRRSCPPVAWYCRILGKALHPPTRQPAAAAGRRARSPGRPGVFPGFSEPGRARSNPVLPALQLQRAGGQYEPGGL